MFLHCLLESISTQLLQYFSYRHDTSISRLTGFCHLGQHGSQNIDGGPGRLIYQSHLSAADVEVGGYSEPWPPRLVTWLLSSVDGPPREAVKRLQRESLQREQTCGCQGSEGDGEGMGWGVGGSRYELLHIEWINKVLLQNTGSYIQYLVINHNGKEY